MAKKSSPTTPTFQLREPQKPLLQLLKRDVPNVLAAGSSRVGKSWLFMVWLVLLCQWYPNSRHGVFRRNRNSCETNLFKLTLYQVLNALGVMGEYAGGINKSDLTITFPNGSIISFHGLDEHNRDKVLGSEFHTIWMNEVSEFDYEDVEFLRGRLFGEVFHKDTGKKLPHRMFFDCNPDTFDDWEYKLFVEQIHPLSKRPLQAPDDYDYVRMVTDDQEYIRRNIDQSDEWKERFIYANWTASNPNALFNRKMINDNRFYGDVSALTFAKIVVGVDPHAVSNATSDLTGIVVAGIDYDGEAYILADRSTNDKDWERIVIEAFDEFEADLIVAERNNGGDMVEKVIRQARKNAPIQTVWASRGKEVRAEPIALKYRQGHVHHVGDGLSELETEMTSFGGSGRRKSPDRMDAMVWAVWALFDIGGDKKGTGTISHFRPRMW